MAVGLLGHSIRTAPQSVVYHRFGGTSRVAGAFFREQLGLRHDLRSLIKNYELASLCKVLPCFFAFLLKATVKARSFRFLGCLAWNLRHLRSTLQVRRVIQRKRRVSDRELSPLIFPYPSVPCHQPDYTPLDHAAFVKSNCRKSWVSLADQRWNSLGHGWHGVESFFGDSGVKYRWSQREAVLYLWNHFGRGVLELKVLGCAAFAGKPRVLYLSINGRPASRFVLRTNDWETIRMDYDGPPGPLEVAIRAQKTWSPGEVFHNHDRRQLGIGVEQIQFQPYSKTPENWDAISVIIPTYNRCEKLAGAEIAGIPNVGSEPFRGHRRRRWLDGRDATKTCRVSPNSRLRITCAKQQNKLQAAARNYGITFARESLLLFLGDDIIPSPILQQHLDFHRRHNPCGDVAVVGQIRWHQDLCATPFMQFVNDYGGTIRVRAMKHPGPWQFDCFYTSNISVPRRMLEKLDYVFDEDFKRYGWEDAELGYRLERNGMRLLYNADAVAYHDHPTTLLQFCRRQYQVGRCSRVFLAKHPELESHLGSVSRMRRRATMRMPERVLEWTANLLDGRFRVRLPASWYAGLLGANYARGVLFGQAESRPAGPDAAHVRQELSAVIGDSPHR